MDCQNEEFKVFKQTNVDSYRGGLVHHYSMVKEMQLEQHHGVLNHGKIVA